MVKFCNEPFEQVGIYPEGHVASCLCAGWHTFDADMGNILETPLVKIYQNEKFEKFRESIFDQSFKYCLKDQCSKLWNLEEIDNFNNINRPTLPIWLNIQIDRNCNLKCGSCRYEIDWTKDANPTAERILNRLIEDYQDFDQPVTIQCDGSGDVFASTAWKNFFMRDDLPKCFQFNITTNGNLVTKNLELLRKIKDQIFSVCISFDAATPETYKVIRGGKFQTLIDGAKAMQDMGIYRVNTSFVTQQKNHMEVMQHYEMCKELNINYSGLSRIDRWLHMTDPWWEENNLDGNPLVNYKYLVEALKYIQSDPKFGLCGGLLSLIDEYDRNDGQIPLRNRTFEIKSI